MGTQESIKNVTKRLSELLTQCLQTAMTQVLREEVGEDWFDRPLAEEKVNSRSLLADQKAISDCDLLTLLKLLRFRTKHTERLLAHFDFDITETQMSSYVRRKQLFLLLERLITRTPCQSLYGDEEAARDMMKLAELFAKVEDGEGNTYNDRMAQIFRQYTLSAAKVAYQIKETIRTEKLKGCSVRSFAAACKKLRIETSESDGELCFFSNDYIGDVESVKNYRKATCIKALVRSGIAVACAAVIAVGGIFGIRKYKAYAQAQTERAAQDAVEAYYDDQKTELERVVAHVLTSTHEDAGKYFVDPETTIKPFYYDNTMTMDAYLRMLASQYDTYDFVPVTEPWPEGYEAGLLFFYNLDNNGIEDDVWRARGGVLTAEYVFLIAHQEADGLKIDTAASDDPPEELLKYIGYDESIPGYPGKSYFLSRLYSKYWLQRAVKGTPIGKIELVDFDAWAALSNGSDEGCVFTISGYATVEVTPNDAETLQRIRETCVLHSNVPEGNSFDDFLKSHLMNNETSYDFDQYFEVKISYSPLQVYVPAHTMLEVSLEPSEYYPFSYDEDLMQYLARRFELDVVPENHLTCSVHAGTISSD